MPRALKESSCNWPVVMVAINAVLFVLGILLIYFGVRANSHVPGAAAQGAAVLGSFLLLLSLLGIVGTRKRSTTGLLIYFYISIAVLMALLLFSFGALFFQDAIRGYLERNWDDLRQHFPEFEGLDRTNALTNAEAYVRSNVRAVGIAGIVTLLFQSLAVTASVKLLTLPVVMRSLLMVTNSFFCLIGICVTAVGGYATSHSELLAADAWVAQLFLAIGLFILLLGFTGIYGAWKKNRSALLVYTIGISVVLILLLLTAVGAFAYSAQITEQFEAIPDQEFSNAATAMGYPGYSKADLAAIISTSVKFIGLMSSLIIVILIVGLLSGWVLRRSLEGYQVDSI
eukprot:PLAT5573.1.p2 GENE.PLAT5573.1~~PLAT5573.1.p2  ORF type:complete len:342 (+),score=184.86 PLAT5573.1:65-1090(+)